MHAMPSKWKMGSIRDNVQYFEKHFGLTPQPELKKVIHISKTKARKIDGMKYILQMFIKKS